MRSLQGLQARLVDALSQMEGHTAFFKHGDLAVQHTVRELPERQDAAQQTAGLRGGIIDVDVMPGPAQVICGQHTGRPGTDDGHLFACRGSRTQFPIRHTGKKIALEPVDADRLPVHVPAVAGMLAGMVADPADDGGKRQHISDQLAGPVFLAPGDELHVPLDIEPQRTGPGTGSPVDADIVQHAFFSAVATKNALAFVDDDIVRQGFKDVFSAHDTPTSL